MDAEERAARVIDSARQARESVTTDEIAAAIREAVEEEREACAEIIHDYATRYVQWVDVPEDKEKSARWQEINALEEAIRARGERRKRDWTAPRWRRD